MWIGGRLRLLLILSIVAIIAGPTVFVLTQTVVTVRISVETDKQTYRPGEPVRIVVEALNTGTATARWSSGCGGPLDFKILDPGGTILYDYSTHVLCFTAASGTYALGPGEVVRVTFFWEQVDDRWFQVTLGRDYAVRGFLRGSPRFPSTFISATIHIDDFDVGVNFALKAQTDQARYRQGDVANVSVTLANIGTATAAFYLLQPCSLQFVILNSANVTLYDWYRNYNCRAREELVLTPGATYSGSMIWDIRKQTGEFVSSGQSYRVVPRFDPWLIEFQGLVSQTEIASFEVT